MSDTTAIAIREKVNALSTDKKVGDGLLTIRDQRIFELHCEGVGRRLTAERMKEEGFQISEGTVKDIRESYKYRQYSVRYFEEAQTQMLRRLAVKADKLADWFLEIVEGKRPADKSAMAAVQALKMFFEAGVKPLINRRPNVQIQTNVQINNMPVVESMAANWTQDQLNEYARTGKKPEDD